LRKAIFMIYLIKQLNTPKKFYIKLYYKFIKNHLLYKKSSAQQF